MAADATARLTNHPLSSRILRGALELHGITVVLDVGANEGQYGVQLRRSGYGGRIVSFEPGSEAHASVTACAAADEKWQ